ncbi:MAG: DUF4338 domain-containing protein [Anaerolineae bacterium]|nr:DUF4338 domain-containing protein [Anaerolineae bacterium]
MLVEKEQIELTIPVDDKSQIRQYVLQHLIDLGFSWDEAGNLSLESDSKDLIKTVHQPSREEELIKRRSFIERVAPKYASFFANGKDINPQKITPYVVEVSTNQHNEIFSFARLIWSLPFSAGFGRRIRYLIFDKYNNKLIGLLGLQSPPLDFAVRDNLFNYPDGMKTYYVNQTMDIQTLGAIPPYNFLLGGKLVAMLAGSDEIRKSYQNKYNSRITEMEKRYIPNHIVALTTTSAYGRSSIYNRLKYNEHLIAKSLGFTEGYGSFHLMHLYPLFKAILEANGVSTSGGYGTGPRIKWQTMERALAYLNLPRKFLKHGIQREAFIFPLCKNIYDYMSGIAEEPEYNNFSFEELASFWKKRWLLPRSTRELKWKSWDKDELLKSMMIWKVNGEIKFYG